MKLINKIGWVVLSALALLFFFGGSSDDLTFGTDGSFVTASQCNAPATREAIMYCGRRHCLNLMQLDKLVNSSGDVDLTSEVYGFNHDPDRVELNFIDRVKLNTIKCVLNKASVLSVTVVEGQKSPD